MTDTSTQGRGYGSVAEEMAALAEALRARRPRTEHAATGDPRERPSSLGDPPSEHIDACGICPICRAIAALHTISPNAVNALADLAHQTELVLRVIATDLATHQDPSPEPEREDIPVDDLD